MSTGRDIVSAALRKIGAIASGESLPAADGRDGIGELNRMVGTWSNESLMIPAKVREEFTLTPGTAAYTMGPAGDFNTIRPIKIVEVSFRDESLSPPQEYPIRILSLTEWQSIVSKEQSADRVAAVYIEGSFPFETLNFFPTPASAKKVVLWSSKTLTLQLILLGTTIELPPGYEDALVLNLALRLAPEYGKMPSDLLMAAASESKAIIKRANHRPSYLRVDDALVPRPGFNFLNGGPQ